MRFRPDAGADEHRRTGFDFQTACLWEVHARKPGNVHPRQSFSDMTALDFALSAAAVGPGIGLLWPSPGRVIFTAVEATRNVCPVNTNLGIILLCVPLAFAHQRGSLLGVWRVIRDIDLPESKLVYDAIRLANPGGLGDAPEQDVRSEPTVTL